VVRVENDFPCEIGAVEEIVSAQSRRNLSLRQTINVLLVGSHVFAVNCGHAVDDRFARVLGDSDIGDQSESHDEVVFQLSPLQLHAEMLLAQTQPG
jgi:hypothetical protein